MYNCFFRVYSNHHAPGPFLESTFSSSVPKDQGGFHSQQHLLGHQNALGQKVLTIKECGCFQLNKMSCGFV
jgi:hypothetical protein